MSARFILTLFIPVLTSCVSYEREEASPQSVADTVAARTSGVLSIDAAIQVARVLGNGVDAHRPVHP